MKNADSLLRQIIKIREVASGEALPYVGRSRLGRLVHGLSTLTEGATGEIDHQLAVISKRIQDIAKTICQPSEPLDSRWRDGWTDLVGELDRLESLFRAASSTTRGKPNQGMQPDA
jgi:hypothetical protein